MNTIIKVSKSKEVDISYEIDNEFIKWCEINIPSYYDKITKTISLVKDTGITYKYIIDSVYTTESKLIGEWWNNKELINKYLIELTCPTGDEKPFFEIYRHEVDKWRFGVDLEDIDCIKPGTGMARLLMTLLVYKTYNNFDGREVIGICADASNGFWRYIGMKEGRFSEDGSRVMTIRRKNEGLTLRDNPISRQICGFDKEFTYIDFMKFIGYKSNKRKRELGALKKKTKKKKAKKRSRKKKSKKKKSKKRSKKKRV